MKPRTRIRAAALVLLGAASLSVGWAAPATGAATSAEVVEQLKKVEADPVLAAAGVSADRTSPTAGAPIAPALLEQLKKIEADPTLTAAALRQGSRVAAVCANCHGTNGNSTYPETPNLAGQNARYLFLQMEKFANGQRRYEFMEGLIRAMSAQERVGAAMFYARQSVPPTLTENAALRAKGKAYFEKVCFRCHGNDGRGSEQYARLAGQQPSYVAAALKRYRNNTQDSARRDPLMAEATRLMSDEDIRAVVAYVASMR